MKKVVTTEEVTHLWAHQAQPEARNAKRSVFFEGDTIYSYGDHFPMARHCKGIILFTSEAYSATTENHKSKTRRAISHLSVIKTPFVSSCPKKAAKEWLRWNQDRFVELAGKAKRARTYTEFHLREMKDIESQVEFYNKTFGTKLKLVDAEKWSEVKLKESKKSERLRKLNLKKQEVARKQALEDLRLLIPQW